MEEKIFKQTATSLEKLLLDREKFNIFNDMSSSDIALIVTNVKFNFFAQGEIIIKENDISEIVYLIISGECEVTISNSIVGILESDAIFGEISGATQSPRQATIIATQDTYVVSFLIDYDSFDNFIVPFAYFYRNITKSLISKIVKLNRYNI